MQMQDVLLLLFGHNYDVKPKTKPRGICLVHGTLGKPRVCREITVAEIHKGDAKAPEECEMCGTCCDGKSIDLGGAEGPTIGWVLNRPKSLRSAKIEPNEVRKYIESTGRIPTRMDLGAKSVRGAKGTHCALFIPERHVKRNAKGEIV